MISHIPATLWGEALLSNWPLLLCAFAVFSEKVYRIRYTNKTDLFLLVELFG